MQIDQNVVTNYLILEAFNNLIKDSFKIYSAVNILIMKIIGNSLFAFFFPSPLVNFVYIYII